MIQANGAGLGVFWGTRGGGGTSEADRSRAGDAEARENLTVESEHLLDQAAGFARGGDYLGAQARARFAEHRLIATAASLPENDAFVGATHAHIDLRIRHYDTLVREWQKQVEERRGAHVARERRAIGADTQPPPDTVGAR